MLHEQLGAGDDISQARVVGWSDQLASQNILDAVVADKMVRHALVTDADGLLD